MAPRRTARQVIAAYDEHDVLTYASAIAFKVTFALIPLSLVGLGVLGVVGAGRAWSADVAPDVRHNVSPAVFTVIDQTVRRVLSQRQLFWTTLGVVLAVWELSGATRAIMGVLDRIFSVRRERSFPERLGVSVALALAVGVLALFAVASIEFGGALTSELLGDGALEAVVGTSARWVLGLACLALLLAVLVRYGPAETRPWGAVVRGGTLTVAGWIGLSALFGVYLRDVADYDSLFGNLATVIVVYEYVYGSAVVLLTGLVVDGLPTGR